MRRFGRPLTEDERTVRETPRPKPGDLVCVLRTDDVLIKEGSCGVVEGRVGDIGKSAYQVTFNPSPLPWWDRNFVVSSGGSVRVIETRDMRPTGKKKVQDFHYFPGLPAAGAARTIEKTVDVWEVDLKG